MATMIAETILLVSVGFGIGIAATAMWNRAFLKKEEVQQEEKDTAAEAQAVLKEEMAKDAEDKVDSKKGELKDWKKYD